MFLCHAQTGHPSGTSMTGKRDARVTPSGWCEDDNMDSLFWMPYRNGCAMRGMTGKEMERDNRRKKHATHPDPPLFPKGGDKRRMFHSPAISPLFKGRSGGVLPRQGWQWGQEQSYYKQGERK